MNITQQCSTTTKKSVITITDNAVIKIKQLIGSREKPAVGIRISVRSGGCSGMSYAIEYANEIMPLDEVVEKDGVRVLVDPKAMLHIIGTELDYSNSQLKEGFIFRNPNEKSRCGCGNSFGI